MYESFINEKENESDIEIKIDERKSKSTRELEILEFQNSACGVSEFSIYNLQIQKQSIYIGS